MFQCGDQRKVADLNALLLQSFFSWYQPVVFINVNSITAIPKPKRGDKRLSESAHVILGLPNQHIAEIDDLFKFILRGEMNSWGKETVSLRDDDVYSIDRRSNFVPRIIVLVGDCLVSIVYQPLMKLSEFLGNHTRVRELTSTVVATKRTTIRSVKRSHGALLNNIIGVRVLLLAEKQIGSITRQTK